MATLSRELRRELERTVKQARQTAEAGARKAIERLGVGDATAPAGLNAAAKSLRLRLRAHGRQLGDRRDPRRETQPIRRLTSECAYEHWHRMLFARFLAETDLLIEPDSGLSITLADCQELARGRNEDWVAVASAFALKMLLREVFRPGDPVLDLSLPPETRSKLEDFLKGLPRDVFLADDSLGWVYQFWQADEKERVNDLETKIGAEELPAVTQLFTEDYMVLFLLHNTLGAWWAGKVLATKPELAAAASEQELRAACSVGGVDWAYLRFVRDPPDVGRASQPVQADVGRPGKAVLQEGPSQEGPWRPAAGTLDGWPRAARDITVLDPCMGSGHFLVFALPILVAFRMAEEGLLREAAVDAVLRENLYGLEIDPRCTQIAAFNLALAAWKLAGYRELPALNLACSGLGPSATEEEWLKLAEKRGMDRRTKILAGDLILDNLRYLHKLFSQAPTLGSLIDPGQTDDDMFAVDFETLNPYLQAALAGEKDEDAQERAVAAAGMVKAAELLAGDYTLVITNVPYLGRGKQVEVLKHHLEDHFAAGKADLATGFVERCLEFCAAGGTTALVTPQNWLFLGTYKKLRQRLLETAQWDSVARLGPRAFETISGEVVNVGLLGMTRCRPTMEHAFAGLDGSEEKTAADKANALRARPLVMVGQKGQLANPDARITLDMAEGLTLLSTIADSFVGILNGDSPRFVREFWEIEALADGWQPLQSTVESTIEFGGRHHLILWENGNGQLRKLAEQLKERLHDSDRRGNQAWGKSGVAVTQMRSLPCTIYRGDLFDSNACVLSVKEESILPALWAFCSSAEFHQSVRRIDQKMNVTNATFAKASFDLGYWQEVAAEKYPHGLPEPESDDPTQWLFHGCPEHSTAALQVAVARLLGYRWPAELNSEMRLSQRARELVRFCDALLPHADDDGIVCLTPVKGEESAADRIIRLLAGAYGPEWSAGKLASLLADAGTSGTRLNDWLRDAFFENHCAIFQNRPFIWHIWDGRHDGFHALVNYHRLAGPKGEGRRTLEKLIYTYVGDWIERQRGEQAKEIEGADARVAAAEHLKSELEKILAGEPPYDLFVRWKPLHEQPIGWEPDINDGVRINIRPFMMARPFGAKAKNACILRVTPKSIKWDKDRGKEPERLKEDYPWFWGWDEESEDFARGKTFDGNRWNDLHYTTAFKQAARKKRA